MGILDRVGTLLRANINDLLDRAEDPEKMPLVGEQVYPPTPSAYDDALASMRPKERAAIAGRAIARGDAAKVQIAGFFERDVGEHVMQNSAGLIARYAPATREFKTWKLPIDGAETPYALNVDRRSDTVWICGTNSDSVISFEPATERFTVYPLPTRVTYTREIDLDDEGGVWTSNSNFPTWQIESAVPKIIRIQPGPAVSSWRANLR